MDNTVFNFDALFARIIMHFGNRAISLGDITIATGALLAALLIWRILSGLKNSRLRAASEATAIERAREAEARMAELVASQNELTGRMQTMSEIFSTRQGGYDALGQ